MPERQLARTGGGAIGQHLSLLHLFTDTHQRPLVDAGVLVGTTELHQLVLIKTTESGEVFDDVIALATELHEDGVGGDALDRTTALGDDHGTRVTGHLFFHTGSDKG